jgi:hypothetical protein
MELKTFNVRELSIEETVYINGGSKIGDFFEAIWDSIVGAYIWVRNKIIDWYLNQYQEYLDDLRFDGFECPY